MTARPARPGVAPWRRLSTWLPVSLLFISIGFAVVLLRSEDVDAPPAAAAVDVAATGPRFATLDEMIAAADVIVEGRIVAVDEGRVITDPSDPTTGFTTALFQLDVARAFRGADVDTLIVEQEATLLDGTPITVNGMQPNRIGDTGFWFLVVGGDDAGTVDWGFGASVGSADVRLRLEQ